MEILKIENLTKVYGKGENEVHALNGVSFSVEKANLSLSSDHPDPANLHYCI